MFLDWIEFPEPWGRICAGARAGSSGAGGSANRSETNGKALHFQKSGSVWAWELQSSKWMIFLKESLRKRTSLSLGAPELQMNDFLNRILKETDQSEPGSSRAPNEWFSFRRILKETYRFLWPKLNNWTFIVAINVPEYKVIFQHVSKHWEAQNCCLGSALGL